MFKAINIFKESLNILRRNPWIALPFLLLALFEAVTLYFIFLAPQQPFATLLAPPIARLYGEQFVHYPFHIYKLPEVFYHCKLLLSLMPGLVMSVIAIGLIGDTQRDIQPSPVKHFKTFLKRFFALGIIWGLNISLLLSLIFVRSQLLAGLGSSDFVILIQLSMYFISFWVYMVFLYAIPSIVLAQDSLLRALINNFRYLKRLFLPTTLCMFMAALLYLGLFFLEVNIQGLAARLSPEIIVVVLAGGICATFFVNLLVTTTSTLLFVSETSTNSTASELTA